MPVNTATFTLNNGVTIPAVGFGTFSSDLVKGETYKAVKCALEVGYRHLDCAWFYLNEREIGDAIHDFLKATPSVKREDLFITTKVWNHLHEPEEVKWSLENSLSEFRLDYVDLFIVHWPIASERTDDYTVKLGADGRHIIKKELTENPEPTWRAMEELLASGKTRAIGVSNWRISDLKKMFGFAKVKPQVNQVELHPFLPSTELVEFCQANDVLIQAFSPLGSQSQVPTTGEQVRTNKALNAVADRSGHTLAQVLLAWGIRRGYVVLPKSSTPSRIASNIQVPEISDEDFEAIQQVAKGRHSRFVNMKNVFGYDLWPEEAEEDGISAGKA
ncbi:NADP-dependent oxidoreductase domain-containing protein [Xylaria intraflava]|nr:NADP-dependent oxidoreductase domain-containing protein [Xylaria intraflava]